MVLVSGCKPKEETVKDILQNIEKNSYKLKSFKVNLKGVNPDGTVGSEIFMFKRPNKLKWVYENGDMKIIKGSTEIRYSKKDNSYIVEHQGRGYAKELIDLNFPRGISKVDGIIKIENDEILGRKVYKITIHQKDRKGDFEETLWIDKEFSIGLKSNISKVPHGVEFHPGLELENPEFNVDLKDSLFEPPKGAVLTKEIFKEFVQKTK